MLLAHSSSILTNTKLKAEPLNVDQRDNRTTGNSSKIFYLLNTIYLISAGNFLYPISIF